MPSSEINNERTKSDETSKNAESDLAAPPQSRRSNSVFDFLYHDARRIGSFLAEFETYGVLQRVTATETASRTESEKSGLTTGLNVAIGKAGTAKEVITGSEARDSAERTYDPLWINARTFLDFLTERQMIIRDLSQARIGQFVLASGSLAIFDLGILKETWKLPAVKDIVLKGAATTDTSQCALSGNRKERARAKHAKKNADSEASAMAFELLKIMPHAIQATIRGKDWTMWSSLREDSLAIPGSELL
jgi:hypothetical protein